MKILLVTALIYVSLVHPSLQQQQQQQNLDVQIQKLQKDVTILFKLVSNQNEESEKV